MIFDTNIYWYFNSEKWQMWYPIFMLWHSYNVILCFTLTVYLLLTGFNTVIDWSTDYVIFIFKRASFNKSKDCKALF